MGPLPPACTRWARWWPGCRPRRRSRDLDCAEANGWTKTTRKPVDVTRTPARPKKLTFNARLLSPGAPFGYSEYSPAQMDSQTTTPAIIGIDLGTTNCALACTRGDTVEVFPIPQLVN